MKNAKKKACSCLELSLLISFGFHLNAQYVCIGTNSPHANGYRALYQNITGVGNTAIGYLAFFTTNNLSNTTCIGNFSGGMINVSNRVEIGNSSVVWIGGQAAWGTYSDARIKKNTNENVPGLDFILRLRPVTYNLDIHKQNKICFEGKKEIGEWEGKYDIEKIKMISMVCAMPNLWCRW
jgi:trimeric autotransporter adhesin